LVIYQYPLFGKPIRASTVYGLGSLKGSCNNPIQREEKEESQEN